MGSHRQVPELAASDCGFASRASPITRGREEIQPPKRGTIEDEEGGYPGFGICIVNDTRADKSEQS